jgi:hypothetical protein
MVKANKEVLGTNTLHAPIPVMFYQYFCLISPVQFSGGLLTGKLVDIRSFHSVTLFLQE